MFVALSQIRSTRKRFIFETLILVVCLCLWGSQVIAAENAQAVVQAGTDQVLKILMEYPQDTRARREKIRAAVDGYFDFGAIARLAVGPRWNRLPPEQQQQFTQEFSKLLFNKYIGDIEKYATQNITYNQRSIYQGYVVVEAHVIEQGSPISIDYYLHLRDGKWKVYDVGVEGTSLVVNYRDQFDSILANGSFDDLSNMLRQQIAQMCGSGRC